MYKRQRIEQSQEVLRYYTEGWPLENGRSKPYAPDVAEQLALFEKRLASAERFLSGYRTYLRKSDADMLLRHLKSFKSLVPNWYSGEQFKNQNLRATASRLEYNIEMAAKSYSLLLDADSNGDCHPLRTEELKAALKENKDYREMLIKERDTLRWQLGYLEAAITKSIEDLLKEYEQRYFELTGNPVPENL